MTAVHDTIINCITDFHLTGHCRPYLWWIDKRCLSFNTILYSKLATVFDCTVYSFTFPAPCTWQKARLYCLELYLHAQQVSCCVHYCVTVFHFSLHCFWFNSTLCYRFTFCWTLLITCTWQNGEFYCLRLYLHTHSRLGCCVAYCTIAFYFILHYSLLNSILCLQLLIVLYTVVWLWLCAWLESEIYSLVLYFTLNRAGYCMQACITACSSDYGCCTH